MGQRIRLPQTTIFLWNFWLVKTDKFKVFAYYTLVLGVIVLVISFIEMCMGHPISFAK